MVRGGVAICLVAHRRNPKGVPASLAASSSMSCRSCLRPARRCFIVQRQCTARIAACKSHIEASTAFRRCREVRLTLKGAGGLQAAGRMPALQSEQYWGPRPRQAHQTNEGIAFNWMVVYAFCDKDKRQAR